MLLPGAPFRPKFCISLPRPLCPTVQVGDAEQRQLEELKSLRQLAFVITDLEASTAIAAAAPRHFEKVRRREGQLPLRLGAHPVQAPSPMSPRFHCLRQLRATPSSPLARVPCSRPYNPVQVQEMHDSLLRELIGRFHGYEINTGGVMGARAELCSPVSHAGGHFILAQP